MKIIFKLYCLFSFFFSFYAFSGVAIKDLVDIEGIRDNQVIGYGLVVGLPGTGEKNSYTQQTFSTMLKKFGISLPPGENVKVKNAAVVSVHANMPAFIKRGQKIDVTVSSLGEAKSLRGGSLLQTLLKGIDGKTYAIAQGSVIVGSLGTAGEDGGRNLKPNENVGRILSGAIVEKEIPSSFKNTDYVTFNLKQPSFATSKIISDAVNNFLGDTVAFAVDPASIKVASPRDSSQRVRFIATIENIEVNPSTNTSKVIVNSHTGTIIVGSGVRLLPVAITHGSLILKIKESEAVDGNSTNRMFVLNPGFTLNELVKAINDVGASPSDVLAILESLKQAGALYGELMVL